MTLCAPDQHEADPETFRVSEEDKPYMVALVDCAKCGATADVQPATADFSQWKV